MNELTGLLRDAEAHAKQTGVLDVSFVERLAAQPAPVRAALAPAFDLLGAAVEAQGAPAELSDEDRRSLCGLVLHRFRLTSGEPTWSSALLQRAFESAGDEAALARALFEILAGVDPLGAPLAAFLDDFARAFASRRSGPLEHPLVPATPPQAYLAARLLSDEALSADAIVAILRKLAGTPWFDGVVAELSDLLTERGIRDRLLPDDAALWVHVQRALRKVG